MIQLLFALTTPETAGLRFAEYFLLEGTSASGLALVRRRLVEFVRATGLSPTPGEELSLPTLVGKDLELELAPDLWQGRLRHRVVGHRPRRPEPNGTEVPF
jgi:hypothetical protein